MRTLDSNALGEALYVTIEGWDQDTLIDYARDTMYDRASKASYGIIDIGGDLWGWYDTLESAEAELFDGAEIVQIRAA